MLKLSSFAGYGILILARLQVFKGVFPLTSQPYAGATAEELQSPLVRELLHIHQMFRREMENMLRYVKDLIDREHELTSAETKARVQALVRAGQQYTHYLHFHHHAESSMLFPKLIQDDPAMAPVVTRLESEHDQIAVLIDAYSAAVRTAAAADPRIIDSDLRRLSTMLQDHLAYEETHVCPLLARMQRWPF
jgi:DUF438 domain-containing protein